MFSDESKRDSIPRKEKGAGGMIWILLILLAALIGVFWKRRELGESANFILLALVVLTLIVSFYSLFRGQRPPKAKLQPEFYTAAGFKIGEAIAADLPQGGTVLVLHAGKLNEMLGKISNAYLEGMKKGFGAVSFKMVEDGPSSQNQSDEAIMIDSAIPLDDLQRFIARAGKVDALVSLLGPPQIFGQRPVNLPPIYLIGQVDDARADGLLRAGIIRAAICYKDNADWKAEPAPGMSLDDIFNLRYVLRRAAR